MLIIQAILLLGLSLKIVWVTMSRASHKEKNNINSILLLVGWLQIHSRLEIYSYTGTQCPQKKEVPTVYTAKLVSKMHRVVIREEEKK